MSRLAVTGALDAPDGLDALRLARRAAAPAPAVAAAVAEIEAIVRRDGDAGLLALAERFDGVRPDGLLVPPSAMDAAWDGLAQTTRDALETLRARIKRHHEAQLPAPGRLDGDEGPAVSWRFDPVDRAGLYVPGGRHPYPSTLLMTAIPALVAGVPDVWVASPPGPDGEVHAVVLATAHLLGLRNVVRCGGAQAVFALALGTQTVPRCDVVAGPGNAYVAAAKAAIGGTCRIDAPAGPSEVLVLADEHAAPERIAAELLAQAEHGPDSVCVAVVATAPQADAVRAAIGIRAQALPDASSAPEALARHGAVLWTGDVERQVRCCAEMAPEHVVVLRADGLAVAQRLRNAGCVFVGRHASVPMGDYAAGPSHVLPTGGAARAYAGVGVETFLRRVHVVHAEGPASPRVTDAAIHLARLEGLPAHAAALEEAARRG